MKNFGSEECKQKSTHTTQIIQQKTRKKSNGLAGWVGRGDTIVRIGRATTRPKGIVDYASFTCKLLYFN